MTFFQSAFIFAKIPIKLCKTDKKNDPHNATVDAPENEIGEEDNDADQTEKPKDTDGGASKENPSGNDQQMSSKPIKTHVVNKAPAIHFARFFARALYALWVSIHINLLNDFSKQDEYRNDKKLTKIVKQLNDKKVIKPLETFAVYSCIHLDYVFRTHSKQAIINDYRYLMNIYGDF